MDTAKDNVSPSSSSKPSKFSVYQNPTFSAVLTANSIQPSNYTFLCIVSFFSASAFALLTIIFRENVFIDVLRLKNLSQVNAYWLAKMLQALVGLIFSGAVFALVKAIFLLKVRHASKVNKKGMFLTKRQLNLLGGKPKVEQLQSDSMKKPPKSKLQPTSSDVLVPLHQPIPSPARSSRIDVDSSKSNKGGNLRSVSTPSQSPVSSSSPYLVPGVVSSPPSTQNSTGRNSVVSSPWSNRRAFSANKITSEEELERFLAEVDERIVEWTGKLSTPPPTVPGFGIVSPNTVASSANTSGTRRMTPLRPVRMSPASQKFSTPPKKGEGDLPPPMSMEESIQALEHLGIYPQIEQWRDCLRQWFSSVLLNPLLNKIETSHIQVYPNLHNHFSYWMH